MQSNTLYYTPISNLLVTSFFRSVQHSFIAHIIHYISLYIYIYIYIYFIHVQHHTHSLRLFQSFINHQYILIYLYIPPYISHIKFILLYLVSFVTTTDINPLIPMARVISSYFCLINYRYHPFSMLNRLLYICY